MVLDKLQKTVGSFRIPTFRGNNASADRTQALFRDLQRSALNFKSLEKESLRWQNVVSGTFTSISDIMNVPLPRTYEETPEGQAIPSESDVGIIGDGVDFDRLAEARNSHVVQLSSVAQLAKAWLDEFRDVQDRMKALETIRIDLESRNRKVASLKGKIEQLRHRLSSGKSGPNSNRDEALLADTHQQLMQAEEHVQAMEENYRKTEEETYMAMQSLAQKCPQLKNCAAGLVGACENTFRAAYEAFVSYGVASSLQYGASLDRSGAVAYHLGDGKYAGSPHSPQDGGWPANGDGHTRNVSYGTSEGESLGQQTPQYGWGHPKPDDYSIESAKHMNRYGDY